MLDCTKSKNEYIVCQRGGKVRLIHLTKRNAYNLSRLYDQRWHTFQQILGSFREGTLWTFLQPTFMCFKFCWSILSNKSVLLITYNQMLGTVIIQVQCVNVNKNCLWICPVNWWKVVLEVLMCKICLLDWSGKLRARFWAPSFPFGNNLSIFHYRKYKKLF